MPVTKQNAWQTYLDVGTLNAFIGSDRSFLCKTADVDFIQASCTGMHMGKNQRKTHIKSLQVSQNQCYCYKNLKLLKQAVQCMYTLRNKATVATAAMP